MLSDEEKQAIEKLSSKKNESTWNDTIRQIKREEIKDVVVTRQKYITTILNLIKKQSKEIKLLKEENEKYKNPPFFDEDKYTENDKIKAKIEEIEKLNEEATGNGYGFAIHYLQSLLEKKNKKR